jgi:adenosine deaminase
MLTEAIRRIPKVDLHVHLEGTISPQIVARMAERNRLPVPQGLTAPDGLSIHWQPQTTPQDNLLSFLKAYDEATKVMKTAADYIDLTHDYLQRSAAEGCIYAELTISVEHGEMVGLQYPDMLAAITEGYERAKKETGIEARLISSCVRHYGPKSALRVAEVTRDNPHPLVTGFGMAGDENAYTVADFKPAFEICSHLGRTAHAGEASGPETVRQARDILKLRRFGHMVRAIEDAELMQEQVAIKAVPEVCVGSNLALKVYPDYKAHPLRRFFDAGLKVTLGSDDPTFFGTSIGREYQNAHDKAGFTETELAKISQNAIEEAFVDETTRSRLLDKISAFKTAA